MGVLLLLRIQGSFLGYRWGCFHHTFDTHVPKISVNVSELVFYSYLNRLGC